MNFYQEEQKWQRKLSQTGLKQAMDEKGKKQIDIIRAAAEQGVKLGKSHISQYVSGKNDTAVLTFFIVWRRCSALMKNG